MHSEVLDCSIDANRFRASDASCVQSACSQNCIAQALMMRLLVGTRCANMSASRSIKSRCRLTNARYKIARWRSTPPTWLYTRGADGRKTFFDLFSYAQPRGITQQSHRSLADAERAEPGGCCCRHGRCSVRELDAGDVTQLKHREMRIDMRIRLNRHHCRKHTCAICCSHGSRALRDQCRRLRVQYSQQRCTALKQYDSFYTLIGVNVACILLFVTSKIR